MKRPLLLVLLLLFVLPLAAQNDDSGPGSGVELGTTISGRITDTNPRAVYYFEGLRGEVIVLRLRATGGDLDPVLAVFDNTGQLLVRRDDTEGSRDVTHTLNIQQTDRYYVVVGRFAYGLGSTSGPYELSIERAGVLSTPGSMLRYGDSVLETITNVQPQIYYTFRAEAGDLVTVDMVRVSGNLDPYLQIISSEAFVIADNDDVPGSDSNDARIEALLIRDTGVYIIVATRYGQAAGESVGSFVLSVELSDGSGLGNSTLAPFPLGLNQFVDGELTADQYQRFYSFEARKDDIISISMDRVSGSLDPYLVLANAGWQPLVENDDGGGGSNSRITDYLIPADGTYYIIATRFNRAGGTTTGRYRLELSSSGNAFDDMVQGAVQVSYGITTTGSISNDTPEQLYAFRGQQGDAVTASMTRGDGNLDAYLELLDANLNRLTFDDDSGGGQDARIDRYVLPATGLYYLRATRYSGEQGDPFTSGTYILVLAQRFD